MRATVAHEGKSYPLLLTKLTIERYRVGFLVIRYRFNVARQHAHMYREGAEVETRSVPRMYVSASQLDHFLDFITSEHIIQELLFGERKLKLSSEKKITVPSVVRKVIPERVIQQYNLFSTETGFAPIGRSTLHNILDVCSASVRNS